MISSELLFKDLPVYVALLDRFGFVLTVNRQWKSFVDSGGAVLPYEDRAIENYGIGENYLRFCAFADPLSPRLITGISQLLAGQTNSVAVVYPRRSPGRNSWFLLIGFPYREHGSRAALLHVDIGIAVSAMIESRTRPDGTLDDSPPDLDLARMAGALEQAVLGQNTLARHIERPVAVRSLPAEPYDERHPPLSKRQWEVLSLMTHGLTNVEIARRLGLSPNTVKIHVSGILARLGLPSRTQAVHWALSQTEDDTTSDQPDRT